MTVDEKLKKAMELLYSIEDHPTRPPDSEWFKAYYLLTGDHMILTEIGWETGDAKEDYINDAGEIDGILDEVNAPREFIAYQPDFVATTFQANRN